MKKTEPGMLLAGDRNIAESIVGVRTNTVADGRTAFFDAMATKGTGAWVGALHNPPGGTSP